MINFDKILLNTKLIDQTEYALRQLPREDRLELRSKIEKLHNIDLLANPPEAIKEINKLEAIVEKAIQGFQQIPLNNTGFVSGFEASGSTIKKLYPMPFAPYAFIGDNYWAAYKARREARAEILRDGYVLVAEDSASKKKIKVVNEILESIKIREFRATAADHLNVFGNCWIDKTINKKKQIYKLDFLLPENIIPLLDKYGYRVVGWQYNYGTERVFFDLEDIDHIKTTSLRSLDLGFPALAPVLVDVEADMFASIYSNTLFKKGGLIKAIVSLDKIEDPGIISDGSYLTLIKKLQELFNRQFSGLRSSGQIAFTPNVTGVHNLTNPKDLEGAHEKTSDKTALKVCECLGVPPERLGISRQSQYQNNALIDDSVALSFDNNLYYLCSIVDEYVNELIEDMGIEGVYIQSAGEYSSISKSAAEFGKIISDIGTNFLTVDDYMIKILHMGPHPDPSIGKQYLGQMRWEIERLKATKPAAGGSKDLPFMPEMPASLDLSARQIAYKVHHPRDIRYY